MTEDDHPVTGGWAHGAEPRTSPIPYPGDFEVGDIALQFPSFTWSAQQPLSRVHRAEYGPVHFATDGDGRFDPPQPDLGWGTCYFSTHPRGAFVEVFGRAPTIVQSDIDDRVMTSLYLPSDLRLANFTHSSIVGRFGITNELSTGSPAPTYPAAQQWAATLQRLGFSGIYYISRHDVEVVTRSVALFGKTSADDSDFSYESEPLDTVADEMVAHFQFVVVDGRPL
jgi:hypothetical protein